MRAHAPAPRHGAQGWYPSGEKGNNPRIPSGALMKAMILNSGQHMGGTYRDLVALGGLGPEATAIPNIYEGYGRMQLDKAHLTSCRPSQKRA